MSRAGGGPQLTASIRFNVTVAQKGTLQALGKDLKDLGTRYGEFKDMKIGLTTASTEESFSIRRLLLDFRMFSFALRTIKNEFGDTIPALDTLTSGLMVFSAAGTGAAAGYDLLRAASKAFRGETEGLSGMLTTVKDKILGSTFAMEALAVTAGTLIGITVGTWIGEMVSGISAAREAIKGFEADIERLQTLLKGLQIEQGALNEEMAFYKLWLDNVEYGIEMQGFATEEQTRLQKYLEQQYRRSQFELQKTTYEGVRYQNQINELNYTIEENQKQIEQAQGRAGSALLRGFAGATPGGIGQFFLPIWQRMLGLPGGQIGAEVKAPGLMYVHPGEFVGTPGQLASNLMGGISGNQISVSISLPGAVFRSSEDLEGALRRGGEAAGAEIERSLSMQRYGVRRSG